MLKIIDKMSLETMKKLLKYLPEPSEIKVTLYDFDYSDIYKQANKLYPELNLKSLNYQNLEGKLENPSNEKILESYEAKENREKRLDGIRFIGFKEAIWTLDKMTIKLDPYGIHVKYYNKLPDYINKIAEELKDLPVYCKIEQTRNII